MRVRDSIRRGIWGWWLPMLLLGACSPGATDEQTPEFQVPVEYYKLDNQLKVVLSPDETAPIVIVGIYYNIGFRNEPRDRTGFAHLFEHMMFQGSQNLGKMEFIQLIQKNGGVLNGSTRFDFTNYFEVVPSHKLETVLWAEADRMKGLAITEENLTNQKGVVINEVKVNVLNQPYGGFPWLDMPQIANENWYNSHNFYGDLEDLESASLKDVQDFFDVYYTPGNAVLVVSGDFDREKARTWIDQYFSPLPARNPPGPPDLTEPKQTAEKRETKQYPLANRPALAFAYHMPSRSTPEYYAMGLIDQILLQGDDSRLHQALVKAKGFTGSVDGGINYLLGNQFNYAGPMLWMGSLFHDSSVSPDQIVQVIDQQIETLRTTPLSEEDLDRARVKFRSSFYDTIGEMFGFGKVDLLASLALFDDDPGRINSLESQFRAVTPELIQRTAQEYLAPEGKTILMIEPGADQDAPEGGEK